MAEDHLKAKQDAAKAARDKLTQAVADAEAEHQKLAAAAKTGHETWAQAEAKADVALGVLTARRAELAALD